VDAVGDHDRCEPRHPAPGGPQATPGPIAYSTGNWCSEGATRVR
jgi:hypothetical protein